MVRVGQHCHVGGVLDKLDAAINLGRRALDLGVTGVTEYMARCVASARIRGNLAMHLGDKRTGGVETRKPGRSASSDTALGTP